MFQLLKISRVNSGIQATVEFQLPSSADTVRLSHIEPTMQSIAMWIEKEMLFYAKKKLIDYVFHKHILSQVSKQYSGSLHSLEKVKKLCRELNGKSAHYLANAIQNHKSDLTAILPHPSHASYMSSSWNLNDLLYWATEILYHRKVYELEELPIETPPVDEN